ncbi:MAG: nucleotidyltransferase family protein [Bryobacterales bacterium]|nr:nucleotidyltransferase family protein [Bryobacterales bacterium]
MNRERMPDAHLSGVLCEALISLCGSFGRVSAGSACTAGPSTWRDELWRLADEHDLTGLLWASQGQCRAAATNPDGLIGTLKRSYLLQIASNTWVLAQLEEIANAFTAHGVRLVALKGAAALLWLYDDIGCRSLSDIDLLVEERAVPEVRRIMEGLGYFQQGAYCSPEDEFLCIRGSHLLPYMRPGCLSVEIHGAILAGRGKDAQAVAESWASSVPVPCGHARLWRLCPAHFLLHAAAHFMKHLTVDGFAPLKGMADMILLLNKCGSEMDWPAFWRTADRWGIASEVATIMATLTRHWGLEIPVIPAHAVPIPARLLGRGREKRAQYAAAMIPRYYVQRLLRARELPGLFPRLRYLYRILFPLPSNLRYRYHLPDGAELTPYYLLHPLTIVGRFIRGLAAMIWMQFSRS